MHATNINNTYSNYVIRKVGNVGQSDVIQQQQQQQESIVHSHHSSSTSTAYVSQCVLSITGTVTVLPSSSLHLAKTASPMAHQYY
jgi:hypothetical protein